MSYKAVTKTNLLTSFIIIFLNSKYTLNYFIEKNNSRSFEKSSSIFIIDFLDNLILEESDLFEI